MPIESKNSNPSYQEQKRNLIVIAKLKLTHKKEDCGNLFLCYHLTRCILQIKSENSNQSYQEQKRNLIVSVMLNITHYKNIAETSFSAIISQGVNCQLAAKTQYRVMKSNKGMYLLV